MTVNEFISCTKETQLIELEDVKSKEIIFLGQVERLKHKNEILNREIKFFYTFDYPTRILIRVK